MRSLRHRRPVIQHASFCCAQRQRQEAFAQRYGTAQEPQVAPTSSPESAQDSAAEPEAKTLASTIEKDVKRPEKEEPTPNLDQQHDEDKEKDSEPLGPLEDRGKAIEAASQDPAERLKQLNISTPTSKDPPDDKANAEPSQTEAQPSAESAGQSSPHALSSAMAMPAPTVEHPESQKPPHLQTPPYVHHFDTYTLVSDLERSGFSSPQAETIMKAVRGLLATNLDLARSSLVSKSDVENETYLFRAACSELRTEVLNLRRTSAATGKSQLSHLQHTYDILSQRTTSELAALRDELKGMLNDRRMDNRQNTQELESAVSEINYKIGVRFGGEGKSWVESLRWVMTRRSANAFVCMVAMILASVWYGSVVVHERERQEELKKKRRDQSVGTGKDMATQTQEVDVKEGREADIAYTSLG